jgi:hypothetical protein
MDMSKKKLDSSGPNYRCWKLSVQGSGIPLFINHAVFDGISIETLLSVIHVIDYFKEWNKGCEYRILQGDEHYNDIAYLRLKVRG